MIVFTIVKPDSMYINGNGELALTVRATLSDGTWSGDVDVVSSNLLQTEAEWATAIRTAVAAFVPDAVAKSTKATVLVTVAEVRTL